MAFCPTLLFWGTKCEEIPATFLGKFVTMQKKKGRVIPPPTKRKNGVVRNNRIDEVFYIVFPFSKNFGF